MQLNNNLIIHIGLHKTGTTFIQNEIFPKFKSIQTIRAWHTQRNIFNTGLRKHILITDEGMSGNPWGGNYIKEFEININKIKLIYNNPKIIFGIRKQNALLLSLYKQHLQEKGWVEIDVFFNKNNTGIVKIEDLYFENRINILNQNFKDVFYYSQEQLLKSPQSFIDNLILFLKINEDVRLLGNIKKYNVGVSSSLQVKVLKKLNYLSSKPYCPNLYSKSLKKIKLTPRHITQYYLKNINSTKFELSNDLNQFISDNYKLDWEYSSRYLF
jgi:hypothetical protein